MTFVPLTSSTLILELLAQVSFIIASGYDARLAASGIRDLPVVERLLVRLAFFARVWLADPDFVDIPFGFSFRLKRISSKGDGLGFIRGELRVLSTS